MKYNETDQYQYLIVMGREGVFTPNRIEAEGLPAGFHKYELVFNENQGFGSITMDAKDRCAGSYFTKEAVPLDPSGNLILSELDFSFEDDRQFNMMAFFGKHLSFDAQVEIAQSKRDHQLMEKGHTRTTERGTSTETHVH